MTKLDAWVWKTNKKKDGWFQGIYPCSVINVYIKQTPSSLHRKYVEKRF